jgi:hypothetical protein
MIGQRKQRFRKTMDFVDNRPAERLPDTTELMPEPKTTESVDEETGQLTRQKNIKVPDLARLRLWSNTDNERLASALMVQVIGATPSDGMSAFGLDMYEQMEPTDGIEQMAAVQIIAAHEQIAELNMKFANDSLTFEQREYLTKAHARFSRVFAKLMENWRKGRSKGHRLKVEHVHIHQGAQAIIGDVVHNPKGDADATK